jgi:hypothetical protein
LGGSKGPWLELETLTDFPEFFGSVLRQFAGHHWLCSGLLFAVPESWDRAFNEDRDRYTGPEWERFYGFQLAALDRSFVAAPGFLQAYAQYLSDDWCEVYALSELPAEPVELLKSLASAKSPATFMRDQASVTAAFCCIDGTLWEFLSRDPALLGTVKHSLGDRSDLKIVPAVLEGIGC